MLASLYKTSMINFQCNNTRCRWFISSPSFKSSSEVESPSVIGALNPCTLKFPELSVVVLLIGGTTSPFSKIIRCERIGLPCINLSIFLTIHKLHKVLQCKMVQLLKIKRWGVTPSMCMIRIDFD
jgi:hypothetical protein